MNVLPIFHALWAGKFAHDLVLAKDTIIFPLALSWSLVCIPSFLQWILSLCSQKKKEKKKKHYTIN
jgi:hypothetical protein